MQALDRHVSENRALAGCKESQFYSLPEGQAVTNIY